MKQVWQRWLARRLPSADRITLDQRRIFIMPTRLGWMYFVLLLALFVGGINFANNLILGLCFWLGAVGVVTILHTFHNLHGLEIGADTVEVVEQNTSFNWRCWLKAAGVRRHYRIRVCCQGRVQCNDVEPEVLWFSDWVLLAGPRGLMRPPRIRVETDWPLGLLQAWSWVALDVGIFVWPTPVNDPQSVARSLSTLNRSNNVHPGMDEWDRLEPYREGVPLTRVAWKQLARYAGHPQAPWWMQQWVEPQALAAVIDFSDYPGVPREAVLARMADRILAETEEFRVYLPGKVLGPGQGAGFIQECLLALAQFEAPVYRLTAASIQSS